MVLIFGFGPGRAQDIGEVAPVACPACHNDVVLHHVVSKKSLRLFFVPVVPYGTDDYLLCPVCSQGAPLTEDQLPDVEALKSLTQSWRAGDVPWERYEAQVEDGLSRLGYAPVMSESRTLPVSPPAPPEDTAVDLAERVEMLVRMHEHGELTDAQFDAAKKDLLGGR